jgi:tetratricopeptide (TPR) repeat protein
VAIVAAVRRTLRAEPAARVALGAATASIAAFAVAGVLDWSWELPVIPVAVLLIVGAVATCERNPALLTARVSVDRRWALAGLAVVAAAAVALPLPGAIAIRDSQDSFNSGNVPQALSRARTAEDLEPWGAAPHLQEALVLEQAGRLQEAQAAARTAVDHEPANWRNWYILARLDFHLGLTAEAQEASDKARELNPHSPFLASGLPAQ